MGRPKRTYTVGTLIEHPGTVTKYKITAIDGPTIIYRQVLEDGTLWEVEYRSSPEQLDKRIKSGNYRIAG